MLRLTTLPRPLAMTGQIFHLEMSISNEEEEEEGNKGEFVEADQITKIDQRRRRRQRLIVAGERTIGSSYNGQ
jgi:hypothetical protein